MTLQSVILACERELAALHSTISQEAESFALKTTPNLYKMSEALKDRSTEVEVQIGAVEDVAQDVRMRVIAQLAAGTGALEDIFRDLASAVGKQLTFKASSDEETESVAVEVVDDGKERVLAPEVQAALLGKLQQRFEAHSGRHEGVNWVDVQRSLEADPAKLWSLQQMETNGHAPDVYMEDDGAYYFGTCSVETPEAHRNIVFDAEAQAYLAEHCPQETCNGNAVDIAAAMGIDLMDETQYRHLQTLGRFDVQTWSWLKTLDEIRRSGFALCGDHGDEDMVHQNGAYDHSPDGAFRGSLRVSKA